MPPLASAPNPTRTKCPCDDSFTLWVVGRHGDFLVCIRCGKQENVIPEVHQKICRKCGGPVTVTRVKDSPSTRLFHCSKCDPNGYNKIKVRDET